MKFRIFSRETESVSKMETQEKQIQIRLKTTQDTFAVPDSTLSVPQNVNPDKLNKLVHNLLQHVENVPDFDFFISDDLLRSSLGEFIQDRADISSEHVLDILYLEQKAAPEPQNSVNHDDWVSGVDVQNGLILSACYDNTVCLWDTEATKKLQIPGKSKFLIFFREIKVVNNQTVQNCCILTNFFFEN